MATTIAAFQPTTLFLRCPPKSFSFLPLKWHSLSRNFLLKPPWALSGRGPVGPALRFPRVPCARAVSSEDAAGSSVSHSDEDTELLWKGATLNTISLVIRALSKRAAVAFIVGLILFASDPAALAASGGMMGGRSFSAPRASSRGDSAPSGSAFSYSLRYHAPSLLSGGDVYIGPAFVFSIGAGCGSFLLMAGFAATILLPSLPDFLSNSSDDEIGIASVLKLQVGLMGMVRAFQRELDCIDEVADTFTPVGLHNTLTVTTLALLQHPDCCIFGYSSFDIQRTVEDGKKLFNQLSIEERGKFDEETLLNVNRIRRQSAESLSSKDFSNEYIVITILVAAKGVHKLPVINTSADLKKALLELGSIPTIQTLAVKVLWTPQNENITLTERELLEGHPLLRPIVKEGPMPKVDVLLSN